MFKDRGELPTLFRPADVAKALGMSEWWVKEQARRGRIPFTRPGRAYRFTAEQVAEIVRMYEARPTIVAVSQARAVAAAAPTKPTRDPQPSRSTTRLRARIPRRAVLHQQDAA
ncbi:helix-turn-helix domain-containing protein [Kitasatospora sp. NPDC056531]|uniref:helix-turn-helix domain-containing protein n=1 Tax=Kitasatospora sp. NPDC056531 TaxID=3345856 RepID=UPI0036B1A23A